MIWGADDWALPEGDSTSRWFPVSGPSLLKAVDISCLLTLQMR
jgi:hypothetical protein